MPPSWKVLAAAILATAAPLGAERLPIRVFNVADGLAGDTVRSLFQDSRGYLWIGTSSGLSRFGGRTFRNYDARDGLGGARIDEIVETTDGTLWVGTGQGLARLPRDASRTAGEVFRPVPVPDTGLAGIGELFADRQGRLWVGTRDKLFVIDPLAAGEAEPRPPRPFALPPGWGVPAIAQCADGDLWFAADGLFRLHGESQTPVMAIAPPGGRISSLVCDAERRLWMVTYDGAVLVTWPGFEGAPGPRPLRALARSPRFFGELPAERGDVIAYDGAHGLPNIYGIRVTLGTGGVWLSSHDGALALGAGLWRPINQPQGLPESSVQAVYEDRDGTVWFGTESCGLARLRRSGTVTYDARDGLASDRISSLAEDAGGTLLVGTGSRDLARWDGSRFVDVTPRHLFDSAVVPGWGWGQFVIRDRRQRTWFPTARGLFRFPATAPLERLRETRADRAYSAAFGAAAPDVFRLYEDRRGDVWVSVLSDWPLQRLVGGERLEIEREIHGVDHGGAPTAFAEDRAGGLWVGFYLGGIGRRDEHGWRFYGADQGLPPGFVNDLQVDHLGRLWVATIAGGVARVDDPAAAVLSVRRYRVQEGLTTDSTRCLAEAPDGAIYIGHSRGVDRLDVTSGRVRAYGADDGMPNNLVRTCLAARNGDLWFGTMHGLVRLDARNALARRAPAVAIAALRVAGNALGVPELGAHAIPDLELAPSQNALEIDLETVGLDQDSKVRIEHRMGAAAPWRESAAPGTLSFPRLQPGRYDLEMRAVTPDGRTGQAARLTFHLLPPLAARPWVRAVLLGLLALLTYAAYRSRVGRLLAVERARTRIASDLHDDVGSGLSRIGMLGEMARRRLRDSPAETDSVLGQISRETAELAENASEIIWAVDPQKDDFESVVVRLRRFAADLLEARGIALRFTAPPGAAQVALQPEVRRAVYLILKESIHNAGKHSGASAVEVNIELRDGHIAAEVRDDGRGIDPARARAAAEEGHRGLPGMRRRAEGVGGAVIIDAPAGAGTRIALVVPLRRGRRFSHGHAKRPPRPGDTNSAS